MAYKISPTYLDQGWRGAHLETVYTSLIIVKNVSNLFPYSNIDKISNQIHVITDSNQLTLTRNMCAPAEKRIRSTQKKMWLSEREMHIE